MTEDVPIVAPPHSVSSAPSGVSVAARVDPIPFRSAIQRRGTKNTSIWQNSPFSLSAVDIVVVVVSPVRYVDMGRYYGVQNMQFSPP